MAKAAVDPYVVLDVPMGATEKDISTAFRKKALFVHPDKNPTPEAAAEFKKLNSAYQLLMDADKRAAFDSNKRDWGTAQGPQFGATPSEAPSKSAAYWKQQQEAAMAPLRKKKKLMEEQKQRQEQMAREAEAAFNATWTTGWTFAASTQKPFGGAADEIVIEPEAKPKPKPKPAPPPKVDDGCVVLDSDCEEVEDTKPSKPKPEAVDLTGGKKKKAKKSAKPKPGANPAAAPPPPPPMANSGGWPFAQQSSSGPVPFSNAWNEAASSNPDAFLPKNAFRDEESDFEKDFKVCAIHGTQRLSAYMTKNNAGEYICKDDSQCPKKTPGYASIASAKAKKEAQLSRWAATGGAPDWVLEKYPGRMGPQARAQAGFPPGYNPIHARVNCDKI